MLHFANLDNRAAGSVNDMYIQVTPQRKSLYDFFS